MLRRLLSVKTNLLRSKVQLLLLATAISTVLFGLLYGYAVLNPTYTNWLLIGGDLSQHFIGWQFYRDSSWTFPIGVAENLAYPHGLAVTFMDSIPLLAIPFKVVSGILPEQFQYFGFWGLGSFILTAFISTLIVRRWTDNPIVLSSVAILAVLSPIMLSRMFAHTALGGHWIILLALLITLSYKGVSLTRGLIGKWSVVLALSIMIHPYFFFMNAALLVVSIVLTKASLGGRILLAIIPVVVSVVTFWVIGGLTFTSVAADQLGEYGFDILALIIPSGWSSIISSGVGGQVNPESVAYFGAGILICVLSSAVWIVRDREVRGRIQGWLVSWQAWSVMATLLLLIIISVSPTVRVGGAVLFSYDLPAIVEKMWSIVRASARLFWPMYYIILFTSIYGVIQLLKKHSKRYSWVLPVFFVLIVAVQFADVVFSGQATARRERVAASQMYVSPLTSPFWSEQHKKSHLVYIGGLYDEDFLTMSQYAATHNMTLNTGYFARSPAEAIKKAAAVSTKELETGRLRMDTVYVFKNEALSQKINQKNGVQVRMVDGFLVVIADE